MSSIHPPCLAPTRKAASLAKPSTVSPVQIPRNSPMPTPTAAASAAVNVVDLLRATRREAQHNATVLDHIATPTPQNNAATTPTKLRIQSGERPPSAPTHKRNHRHHDSSPPPRPSHPISKYVLSSLFAAVDKSAAQPKHEREKSPNYAFIDINKGDNFLYGLVLPLIARLLAVSCPGILCVVQLPRQEAHADWTPSPYTGFAYNYSNGSKSLSHTTPSPQDTSRTASPSDEEVGSANRKSISPDSNPGTAELIRHADKILSGAEAAAEKRAAEARISGESSPPPESNAHGHSTLRLMCNGFEVLTGKMPPPKHNMGSFTMASVGWEKAGVVSPATSRKGVAMSFSNGMMVPTEGIVVTFSNGSMCFLTVRDTFSAVESLNVSDETPVVAFSFVSPGEASLGSRLHQESSSLTPDAARVRATCQRPNVFFVEVGDAGGTSHNDISIRDEALEGPRIGAASFDVSAKEGALTDSRPEKPAVNGLNTLSRRPAVVIAAVPRAVPLFVNTINQTVIDGPYCEVPENAYENQLASDRCHDLPDNADLRRARHDRGDNQEEGKVRDANESVLPSAQEQVASQNRPSKTASPAETPIGQLEGEGQFQAQTAHVSAPGTGPAAVTESPSMPVTSASVTHHAPTSGAIPARTSPDATHSQRPSLYGFYRYGPGPAYPGSNSQGHAVHASRPIVGPPVGLHQGQAQMNGAHAGYYHPIPSATPGPNGHGHYQHQPAGCYPTHQYYALSPASMVHQLPQNNAQWHPGLPSMSHPPVPPPHPMDARRDMPVHFSSHRAVASVHSQYAAQNYARPSAPSHSYDARQSGVTPGAGIGMYPDRRQPMAESRRASSLTSLPSRQPHPLPRIDADTKDTSTGAKATHPIPPGPAFNTTAGSPKGQAVRTGSQPWEFGASASRNEQQATDKESVLRALMEMRTGVLGDGRRRQEKRRRSAVDSVVQPRPGIEYSARGRNNVPPNKSSEVCIVRGDVGGAAAAGIASARPPANGRFLKRSRSRVSTGTNSSTSTDSHSQGGPLMHGAVIGNSHNPDRQGYGGSQQQNKRSRQR